MSYSIEFIYLLVALIFLIIVSINITTQMFTIYISEDKIYKFFSSSKTLSDKNNLDVNVISDLLIKKSQWIEAIQVLKLTFVEKQTSIYLNSNDEAQLFKTLYFIYNKLQEPSIAQHYNRLILSKSTVNDKTETFI